MSHVPRWSLRHGRSSLRSHFLASSYGSLLLDELSTAVREGSRNFHSLHRSTLQRMLEDLLKEFRDDKNAEE